MAELWAWPLLLGGLGAIVGSFLATLVIRWLDGRSVVAGRSACDGCGRVLGAAELVPVVSALVLRGRCRTCRTPIDPRHRRIELAAAAIGVAAGVVVPGPAALAGVAFGWLLLTLATLDWAAMWLPDRLTITLAAAGLATGMAGVDPPLMERLIGGGAGFASLWLIAAGYRRWRGHDGMGGGDPKLFGAIGLWLGWRMLPPVLLLASLTGLAVVLWRQATGRPMTRLDAMPLGTLLAIAAYPAWLAMIWMGA